MTDPWAGSAGRRFVDEHYASTRGQVRTRVVDRHLRAHLPPAPAAVIDVGGGAGTQSLLLARRDYEVVLVDPSTAMLDRARSSLAREPAAVAERVTLLEAPGEHASAVIGGRRFAGVLCHGVLPYVADPDRLIAVLCGLAQAGGIVSILSKRADTLAVRPALEGRWADALNAFDATTEINALGLFTRGHTIDGLGAQLAVHGVVPQAWYGVRLFSDRLPGDHDVMSDELDDIVAVEFEASRRDPYRQLSRLFHLIGRRRT